MNRIQELTKKEFSDLIEIKVKTAKQQRKNNRAMFEKEFGRKCKKFNK